MLVYNRGNKMRTQGKQRIPHFLYSNNQDTLHLGDVLRWRVRGQAHE